jgi:hypothetical protein
VEKDVRAEGHMDGLFEIEPVCDIPSSIFICMQEHFFLLLLDIISSGISNLWR